MFSHPFLLLRVLVSSFKLAVLSVKFCFIVVWFWLFFYPCVFSLRAILAESEWLSEYSEPPELRPPARLLLSGLDYDVVLSMMRLSNGNVH